MTHHTASFHPTHLPFDTLLLAVNVFALVMLLIVVAICCSSQRICRHDAPATKLKDDIDSESGNEGFSVPPGTTILPHTVSWWRARTGRGDGRANAHFMEERKS